MPDIWLPAMLRAILDDLERRGTPVCVSVLTLLDEVYARGRPRG